MTEKTPEKKSQKKFDPDETALASPSDSLPSIFDGFMEPFDQLMESFIPQSMKSSMSQFNVREPTIDIHDRGDHFVVVAELPGYGKDEVEVQVHDNALELKAEKKTDSESKEKGGIRFQKSYTYFQKYLSLPEQVRSDKVDGTMKNGILELKLPKKEAKPKALPRRIDLK
jgi:HSP20 family protein